MVEAHALTLGTQLLTQLLATLSRAHIDDARTLDIAHYSQHMLHLIIHTPNDIREVGSRKARAYNVRLREAEVLHNIARHDVGCRCRERQHCRLGLQGAHFGNAQV